MIGFRIWYESGAVYEGVTLADWKRAPARGVLLVYKYGEGFRARYNGADWYYWLDDDLHQVASQDWGTWQPKPSACRSCAKKGIGVSDEAFAAVLAEGDQSAWL